MPDKRHQKSQGTPLHHMPQLRTGNSRGQGHSSDTSTLLQHKPQKRAPLPSNGMFSSLCHTLPQALNVFQVLNSRVRDREGWRCSHTACIDRPWFATPQRRHGNSTWAGTHIRRDSHLQQLSPGTHPGLLRTTPRISLPSGGFRVYGGA